MYRASCDANRCVMLAGKWVIFITSTLIQPVPDCPRLTLKSFIGTILEDPPDNFVDVSEWVWGLVRILGGAASEGFAARNSGGLSILIVAKVPFPEKAQSWT